MFPEEIEVWYVLPALRREMSKELKKLGFSSTAIAKKLAITKGAVSQYLSKKRGCEVVFDEKIKSMIKKSARNITNGGDAVPELRKILLKISKTDVICKIHKKYASLPVNCRWCKNDWH